MTVGAEADQVPAADGQVAVEGPLLGHVAEPVVAAPGRFAVDPTVPAESRDEAEQHLEQGRLAGAVRAEHGQELARRRVRSSPDHSVRVPAARRRARSSTPAAVTGSRLDSERWRRLVSCDSCHCW